MMKNNEMNIINDLDKENDDLMRHLGLLQQVSLGQETNILKDINKYNDNNNFYEFGNQKTQNINKMNNNINKVNNNNNIPPKKKFNKKIMDMIKKKEELDKMKKMNNNINNINDNYYNNEKNFEEEKKVRIFDNNCEILEDNEKCVINFNSYNRSQKGSENNYINNNNYIDNDSDSDDVKGRDVEKEKEKKSNDSSDDEFNNISGINHKLIEEALNVEKKFTQNLNNYNLLEKKNEENSNNINFNNNNKNNINDDDSASEEYQHVINKNNKNDIDKMLYFNSIKKDNSDNININNIDNNYMIKEDNKLNLAKDIISKYRLDDDENDDNKEEINNINNINNFSNNKINNFEKINNLNVFKNNFDNRDINDKLEDIHKINKIEEDNKNNKIENEFNYEDEDKYMLNLNQNNKYNFDDFKELQKDITESVKQNKNKINIINDDNIKSRVNIINDIEQKNNSINISINKENKNLFNNDKNKDNFVCDLDIFKKLQKQMNKKSEVLQKTIDKYNHKPKNIEIINNSNLIQSKIDFSKNDSNSKENDINIKDYNKDKFDDILKEKINEMNLNESNNVTSIININNKILIDKINNIKSKIDYNNNFNNINNDVNDKDNYIKKEIRSRTSSYEPLIFKIPSLLLDDKIEEIEIYIKLEMIYCKLKTITSKLDFISLLRQVLNNVLMLKNSSFNVYMQLFNFILSLQIYELNLSDCNPSLPCEYLKSLLDLLVNNKDLTDMIRIIIVLIKKYFPINMSVILESRTIVTLKVLNSYLKQLNNVILSAYINIKSIFIEVNDFLFFSPPSLLSDEFPLAELYMEIYQEIRNTTDNIIKSCRTNIMKNELMEAVVFIKSKIKNPSMDYIKYLDYAIYKIN
mgnify:CR=1 FL=1